MCETSESCHNSQPHLSRREILRITAAMGLSTILTGCLGETDTRQARVEKAPIYGPDGIPLDLQPASHAMHLHGEWSEGPGRWPEHVRLAEKFGIDYLWPSEHDWRIFQNVDSKLPTEFQFGSSRWIDWEADHTAKDGSSQIIQYNSATALLLRTDSRRKGESAGYSVTGHNLSLRSSPGKTVSGTAIVPKGVFELAIHISNTNESAPIIRYRFSNEEERVEQLGPYEFVIYKKADRNTDGTVHFAVNPVRDGDIAKLWPDMIEPSANAISSLEVKAISQGNGAEVILPKLDITPTIIENEALEAYHSTIDRLDKTTDVTLTAALEYSWTGAPAHVNGFYPDMAAPYLPESVQYADDKIRYPRMVAEAVHRLGGVAARNHIGGTTNGQHYFGAKQMRKARAIAGELTVDTDGMAGLGPVDMVELYTERGFGGEGYLEMIASLWRSGLVFSVTSNSDDHKSTEEGWRVNAGVNWSLSQNPDSASDQMESFRRGESYVTTLDHNFVLYQSLNEAPMGSSQITESRRGSNNYRLSAVDLPPKATVLVYQIPIDFISGDALSEKGSGKKVIATLSARDLKHGPIELNVKRDKNMGIFAVVRGEHGGFLGMTQLNADLKEQPPSNRLVPKQRDPFNQFVAHRSY